ncbi:MAG: sporulation protein YqfC [Candidatus Desulforudis sp.]|nr:sporulation protein YqfC [Desulforudis sp.]
MGWRDLRKKVRRTMADILEIPGEIALDLPKIILVGNVQVIIENHRGIVEYSADSVRVVVPAGEVTVRGRELVLRNILPDELCIEGRIESLGFV